MSDLGQLCYKKNHGALAFKKGGSALIFKSMQRPIMFIASWSPKQFTCNTYGATHNTNGAVSLSVTSGSATINEMQGTGGDFYREIIVTRAPVVISISLSCSMRCEADEYVPVTFRLMAQQLGVGLVQASLTPPGAPTSSMVGTLRVDSAGNLQSIG